MAVRDSPGSSIPRVTSRVSLVTSRVGLADCDAGALLNFYHNEEVHLLRLVSILLRQTKPAKSVCLAKFQAVCRTESVRESIQPQSPSNSILTRRF